MRKVGHRQSSKTWNEQEGPRGNGANCRGGGAMRKGRKTIV